MYVRCKEGDDEFIIDTEKKEVFEVVEGAAELMKIDSDSFVRFRPYLDITKEMREAPKEIVAYRHK